MLYCVMLYCVMLCYALLCFALLHPFSPPPAHGVCVYPPQARQLSPAKSATDEGLVPSGESGEDLVALNLIEDGQVLVP